MCTSVLIPSPWLTYHLWHRVYLSLSCGQALVLLWTFNHQLLLLSFTGPSLHCQQLRSDVSELNPKEKWTVSISYFWEDFWCWVKLEKFVPNACSLLPSLLRLLWLRAEDSPRLRRWPLLHSAAAWGSIKHPLTYRPKLSDPTLSTCIAAVGWQSQTKETHSSSITVWLEIVYGACGTAEKRACLNFTRNKSLDKKKTIGHLSYLHETTFKETSQASAEWVQYEGT